MSKNESAIDPVEISDADLDDMAGGLLLPAVQVAPGVRRWAPRRKDRQSDQAVTGTSFGTGED